MPIVGNLIHLHAPDAGARRLAPADEDRQVYSAALPLLSEETRRLRDTAWDSAIRTVDNDRGDVFDATIDPSPAGRIENVAPTC
jgi:hypothetical protein